MTASWTFQLDQDQAGFELVDDIREASVTSGTADLSLPDCRHLPPPYHARHGPHSTRRATFKRVDS